eukprot:TRINITY_DN1987_c0_g1_i1.p1 TRINITY_DN1987_c0_g1~~TRINITY_DN1987_c0_g1_i1.p1  ORF type:complete len:439 (+),score=38.83 TRINITY_DN1987_c0_g1_i1:162-1478(+)
MDAQRRRKHDTATCRIVARKSYDDIFVISFRFLIRRFAKMKNALFCVGLLLSVLPYVAALDNGLALLPPMGWTTWCTDDIIECYDDFCNDEEIREIADAMVSNGMLDLGYNYINLDDCWAGPRDENGTITADSSRFPKGMKPLADYLHSQGFKFGLYTCAGNVTCRDNRPGSWGHFEQDANTYAEWGIDQVKMDWCSHPDLPPVEVYSMMRDALNQTGRPILYSICEWGKDEPWTWGGAVGNMWRVGPDHLPFYWLPDTDQGVIGVITHMAHKSNWSHPGGWNDPDFLMTGALTMSDTDSRTEFSFWALWAAPLIVSTDVRDMSNKKEILLNKEIVAVNQDPLAIAGDIVANYSDGGQVWSKPLHDGSYAIILFNPEFWYSQTVSISWDLIWPGIDSSVEVSVRDLWEHEDLGNFASQFSISVDPHAVVMIQAAQVSQ